MRPSMSRASTRGAPGSYTDAGPPERITPFTLRDARSSHVVAYGRTSQYTRHSRTRRAMSCAYWAPRSTTAMSSRVMRRALRSILRRPGERERAQPHRRHPAVADVEAVGEAVERLEQEVLLDRDRAAQGLVIRLRETQVAHGIGDLAVLDGEDAIAGHSGDDRLQGVHRTRVPEARDQEPSLHATDQIRARGRAGLEPDVHRERIRVGRVVRMSGVARLVARGGLRVEDDGAGHAP